jgi:FMN phosphatase YigB (HAD superfamily)
VKIAFVDLDYTVLVNPMWPGVFPHFARHVAAASRRRPAEDEVLDALVARSRALSVRHDVGANDWDRLMGETAAAYEAPWTEPVAALVEHYRCLATVVPGAHEMLATLRASGWTCIAASAGYRRFQLPSLRHLGLLHCFDALRFADDVGSLKRRLAFYDGLGHDAATHVACIGDSYVDDCLYPARFGFATIWFTGARRSQAVACGRSPGAHVQRLDRVADALAAVESAGAAGARAPGGVACSSCGGPGASAGPCALCRCLARHELWDGDRVPDRPRA